MMKISGGKGRRGTSALLGVAVLGLAIAAYADPPAQHSATIPGHDDTTRNQADHRDRPEHPNDTDRSGHPEHPDRVDHAENPNAGLHLGWEQESAEQHAAKIAARRAFERQIADAARKDGKEVTGEERDLIRAQWRRHARLWKIRELAEVAKDTATVQKCDQLLSRSDAWLVNKLQDLNAKAPPRGAK